MKHYRISIQLNKPQDWQMVLFPMRLITIKATCEKDALKQALQLDDVINASVNYVFNRIDLTYALELAIFGFSSKGV